MPWLSDDRRRNPPRRRASAGLREQTIRPDTLPPRRPAPAGFERRHESDRFPWRAALQRLESEFTFEFEFRERQEWEFHRLYWESRIRQCPSQRCRSFPHRRLRPVPHFERIIG